MTTTSIFSGERQKLFSIATEEYVNFRYSKTDYHQEWEEEYKYKILDELNKELSVEDISADNVLGIITRLKEKNPQSGSFVHWSDLDDLSSFAESQPGAVVELLVNLFNNADSISHTIANFRESGKEFDEKIHLGTPLFGYILAAFDRDNYTIYKDGTFRDFSTWFGFDIPSDVEEKYEKFTDLCLKIRDYFREESILEEELEPSVLDAQDFIFSLSGYPSLRFKVALRYLAQFSGELAHYEESPSDFLDTIQEMDREYLKNKLEDYRDSDKIRLIRHNIISGILESSGDLKIDSVNDIMEDVAGDYDTDILHSWDYFKILFQIYFDRHKQLINSLIQDLHRILRESIQEKDFTEDKVTNDFSWNNNFGCSRAWLALYPENRTTHRNSAQLFLEVDGGKVNYGLVPGDQIESQIERDVIEDPNISDIYLHNILEKFHDVMGVYERVNAKTPNMSSLPEPSHYFWATANPSIWSVENLEEDGKIFYAAQNKKLNKRRIWDAYKTATPGDKVLFYESAPAQKVKAIGTVLEGIHEENEHGYDSPVEGVTIDFDRLMGPVTWAKLMEIEDLQSSSPIQNRAQGSLFQITKDEYETILSLEPNITPKENIIPSVDLRREIAIHSLYFPQQEAARLKSQISAALQNGKHIILIGPPGTGKSKLAKEVCESFVGEDYKMVTATSDWSTFDTVGGYHPTEEGSLSFQPGIFLESFKEPDTNRPRNRWLILDELNRADIDKAFGSLFSALTGDEISLSFKAKNGESVLVCPQRGGEDTVVPTDHEFLIPKDWRLIATMNTYDKTSLYEMSYAFMRRFAFISVPAPKREHIEGEIQNYLDRWEIEERKFAPAVAKLWKEINKVRKIGPATVKDIYETLLRTTSDEHETDLDYSSALIMHVLPQFEGLLEEDIVDFVKSLKRISEEIDEFDNTDMDEITNFATEYFQINWKKLESSGEEG